MLTKEECLKALRVMQYHLVRDPNLTNASIASGKFKRILKPRFQRKVDIIKQLIEEHFKLIKCDLDCKNCWKFKLVEKYHNPPLKYDELKEYIWVWDNGGKRWIELYWDETDKKFEYYVTGSEGEYSFYFEENRYYRKQVE